MKITPRGRKTKNGFSIYLDKYVNGKRTYETIFKNVSKKDKNSKLVEAEKIINQILKNYNSYTVFEVLDEYKDNYLQRDVRVINAVVRKFKEFIGEDIQISDLNITHMKDFRYYLRKKANLEGETASSYSIRFKKILQYLYDKDLISLRILNTFKLIYKFSNKPKQILTPEEFNELYKNFNVNDEIHKSFLFSCLTGLGLSEIKKLKKDNINGDKLLIKRCKTDNYIDVQLCEKALKLIENTKSTKFIFDLTDKSSKKVYSDYIINKHLKQWMKDFMIDKHITYYCARHTYCNFLFKTAYNTKNDCNGIFYVVSKGMGHSKASSTYRYLNNL